MNYLALFLLILSLGCGKIAYYRTNPVTGDQEKIAQANIFGNGCVIVTRSSDGTIEALMQHAGMSTVLGDTLRSITSVAGDVFGAQPTEQHRLKAHEGCAGVFETGIDRANGRGNTDAENNR